MSGSSERGGRDEATCWGFLTQPSGYQYVQAGSFDGRSEVSLTISTGDVVGMVIDRINTGYHGRYGSTYNRTVV